MQRYITPANASLSGKVRLGLYYCQRIVTSRRVRRLANWILLCAMRRWLRAHAMPALASAVTAPLQREGVASLPAMISSTEAAQMRAWLTGMPMIDSRGSGATFTLDAVPVGCKLGDYPLETVVNCPFVMEIANHPAVLALAADHLGFTPTITGLGLRWTFPSDAAPDEVQSFHRDCELGSFKMLIYLTDVDENAGPHTFVMASHHDRMPLRLRIYSDSEVLRSHGSGVTVLGPAGTAFAIDTRGLHKGTIPTRTPRLMLNVQYSLLPCLLFEYAPVFYSGNAIFAQYVNRLMIG